MGSYGEDPNKGIDASVGGLVWVRRRNGSWWPGKILSPDELPEGCVPTPRSGTPVKLLGREDASVDWYNLEKSKRVKAFHCGEYEDCIEKVKASASHPSKKAVKYARRDDAILQALKLESARIGNNDHQDLSSATPAVQDADVSPSEKESEDADEDSNASEDDDDDDSDSVSQPAISFEERDCPDLAKEGSKPHDSEEDGVGGGKKRMRGLEDLGMGTTSSLKRKRSQVGHVHENLKRKNRRRTLTKVLECTAMVSVPVDQSSGLESHESEKNNDNELDRKKVLQYENGMLFNASEESDDKSEQKDSEIPDSESCQKLFDVPLVDEENNSAVPSGASHQTQVGGGPPESTQRSRFKISPFEGQTESGSTSSGTAHAHLISQRLEKGAPEWRLKGKRNSRSRKVDLDDEAEATGVDHRDVKSRPIAEIGLAELRGWGWNNNNNNNKREESPMAAPQRLLPYRQSRFTVNPKYDSSDFSLGPSRHAATGLYDVAVGVKSTHPPQRVPYISLMSKLTGRPIIGHPLAVEAVKDGFCDSLIAKAEFGSSPKAAGGGDEEGGRRRRRASGRGRPPTGRLRPQRNGLHSKKVRKLSSLTGLHRLSWEEKKPVVEKLKGPSIACVPLKVVFSRINAALSGLMRLGPRPVVTDGI